MSLDALRSAAIEVRKSLYDTENLIELIRRRYPKCRRIAALDLVVKSLHDDLSALRVEILALHPDIIELDEHEIIALGGCPPELKC